jgi:hypothetical protein
MNMKPLLVICISIVALGFTSNILAGSRLTVRTTSDLLREKRTLQGHEVAIVGFVRFDRLSRRGFLYGSLKDLRERNFRKTIFLKLGNEKFSSLQIPDEKYVIALGYLSEELRGPLGVYAAHVIVHRIELQNPKSK